MDKTTFLNEEKIPDWNLKSLIIFGFFILFLFADFVSGHGSVESHTTRYVYLSGINILLLTYLLYTKQYKGLIDIKNLRLPFILYTCFIFLSGLSFFGSANLPESIINFTYLIIVFTAVVLCCVLIKEHQYIIKHLIFLVILIVCYQSLQIFFALLKLAANNFTYVAFVNLLKSNFGNINVLAASLTLKTPFLLFGFLFYNNWKKYVSAIAYLVSIIVILLISARASFISIFMIHVTFFFLYFLYFEKEKKVKIINSVIVIGLLSLSVVSANFYFKNIQNVDRFSSVQNRIKDIKANDNDGGANLRLGFWHNGLELMTEHPVFGIGIGNWKISALPLEKGLIDKSDTSVHCHNDFIEIASETGILNGLIFIAIFVTIFFVALKNLRNSDEMLPKTANLLSILLLISYVIDSFFNFPLYIPSSQIYLVLIFVFTFIGAQNSKKSSPLQLQYLILFLTVSGIAAGYVSYQVYKSFVIVQKVRADFMNKEYQLKSSDLLGLTDEATFVVNYTATPFPEYLARYYINEKQYDKAIVCIKKAAKINPYLGHDDWQRYKIYMTKKQYDSAYYYVNEATHKRPRNNIFYKGKLDVLNIQKDGKEIVTSFNLLREYHGQQSDDYFHTARILKALNYNPNEVTQILDEGIEKFPTDTLLINLKTAVPSKRELAVNQIKLAGAAFAANKNEEALQHYLEAIKIDPDNIIVVQNIGIIYAKLKKQPQAIPYLLQALNSGKFTDGKTEYVLGVCYVELSNKEKACEYMKMAASKNFSNAAVFVKDNCK